MISVLVLFVRQLTIRSSQLMRSRVAAQNIFGMRILAGALERRELVVAVEAYGGTCTEQLGGSLWTNDMVMRFSEAFDTELKSLGVKVAGALLTLGQPTVASQFPDVLTLDARLRRLIVYSLLYLVPLDFPAELAYLVHREIRSPLSAVSNRHVGLLLLKRYSFSPFEEIASMRLERKGTLSDFGCPSFMMPQARRSEMSYSEHVSNCLHKASSARQDISKCANSDGIMEYSPTDCHALRNRWFRMGSMFVDEADAGLSDVLFNNVMGAWGACNWLETQIKTLGTSGDFSTALEEFVSIFDFRWSAVVEMSIVSLEILNSAMRSIFLPGRSTQGQSDVFKSPLLTGFGVVYTKLGNSLMDTVPLDQLLELYTESTGQVKASILKILVAYGDLVCWWWRVTSRVVDTVGLGLSSFQQVSIDGKNLLLHRVFVCSVKSIKSSRAVRQCDKFSPISCDILTSAFKIWRSCLNVGSGLRFALDFVSLFLTEDQQLECACDCPNWERCFISRALGLIPGCDGANDNSFSSSVVIGIMMLLEKAIHCCAAVFQGWDADTLSNTTRLIGFLAPKGVPSTAYRSPDIDRKSVVCLAHGLIRLGGRFLKVFHDPRYFDIDTVTSVHRGFGTDFESRNMLNNYLASLLGELEFSHRLPLSETVDAEFTTFSSSVSLIATMGIGLCKVLDSIESNAHIVGESGSDDMSSLSRFSCAFVNSTVQESTLHDVLRQIMKSMPYYVDFFTVRCLGSGSADFDASDYKLVSNSSLECLPMLEHLISTLRLFRSLFCASALRGASVPNPSELFDELMVLLSIFLKEENIIKNCGPVSDPTPIRTRSKLFGPNGWNDTEANGLFYWKCTVLRQIVLLDVVGLLGSASQLFHVKEESSNNFISIVLQCISEFSGQLKTVSLNLAIVFSEFMMLRTGLDSKLVTNDSPGHGISGAVLRVLSCRGLNTSPRLEYSSVLDNSTVCDALLESNLLLAGYIPRSMIGPAQWLHRTAIFGSIRRTSETQSVPWMYEICSTLQGCHLWNWFAVLLELLDIWDNTCSGDLCFAGAAFCAPDGSNIENLGNIAVCLLELTLPGGADKWKEYDLNGEFVSDDCVQSFIKLLGNKLAHLQSHSESTYSYHIQIMKRVHSKFLVPPPRRTNNTTEEFEYFGSFAEFTAQLLDSLLGAVIDHRIHASALAFLISPVFGAPRQIQQSIWAKLGEERLLHLLCASTLFKDCSVCFLPHQAVDADVRLIEAMCFSVGRLRDQNDVASPVCLVCIFRIAQFLFGGKTSISGKKFEVLYRIMSGTDMGQGCYYSDQFVRLLMRAGHSLATVDSYIRDSRDRSYRHAHNMKLLSHKLLNLLETHDDEKWNQFILSTIVTVPRNRFTEFPEEDSTLQDMLVKYRSGVTNDAEMLHTELISY